MKLVVSQPFADFQVGDTITDPEKIAEVLDSHPGSVVKTSSDPAPEALAFPTLTTSDAVAKATRR